MEVKILRNRIYSAFLSLVFIISFVAEAAPNTSVGISKPKYGPDATRLSLAYRYIQQYPAPNYWALSPYYIAQQTDSACSLASVSMIVNAARLKHPLTDRDKLVTQNSILERVNDQNWYQAVQQGGQGVSLAELQILLAKSLHAFGINNFKIETVYIKDTTAKTKMKLRQVLIINEKSANDFIIANFDQGNFTGDTSVGHFSPVGAYDAKQKKVLIFDTDRQLYEPYWVSEETFLKGMATLDPTGKNYRGYLWVKLIK